MKKKAVRKRVAAPCTLFSILLFTLAFAQVPATAADLAGNVQGAGLSIAGSTVTLYAAGPGAPTQLAQGKTDDNGAFNLNVDQPPADSVLYLVAKGGTSKAAADKGPNDAIALMAVLGTELPKTATVNELTTVASAFAAAQFIHGESISGNPLGLRIAAGKRSEPGRSATGSGAKYFWIRLTAPDYHARKLELDWQFLGRGVVLMAGDDTKGHPAGTKMGDCHPRLQRRQHPDAD